MDLGDAKYTVTLDDKATAKMKTIGGSMKDMGAKMAKVGAIMAAAAAAVTAAVGLMVKDWAAAGDEVAKMAKRTGFGVEALSELKHVAELGGTSLQSVEKAVKRMSSTIEDAKDGLETYTRSFDKLGISVDDIAKMQPEEQFWAIADAIAALEDPTMRAAIAQDFFGRAGTDLLPMLAEGTEAIAEQRQAAHDLGLVFDEEAAESAVNLTDAMTEMKGAFDGVKFAIVDELAPVITALVREQIVPAIMDLRAFIEENNELAETFLALANGAIAFAQGLAWIAAMFKKVDEAIPDELQPILGILTGRTAKAAGEQLRGMEGYAGPPGLQPGLEAQFGDIARGVQTSAVGGSQVNVNVGTFVGNDAALREFTRAIEQVVGQDTRRTSFPGVNRLGYFPGSSAP